MRNALIHLPADDKYHGVLHYIGTDAFSKPWQNPYLLGKVNVLARNGYYLVTGSNTSSVVRPLEVVVGKPSVNSLGSAYDSQPYYFTVDLGPSVSISITHYGVYSHYQNGWSLKNFTVLVSKDNTTWTEVAKHEMQGIEITLQNDNVSEPTILACNRTEFIRYFKIESTTPPQIIISSVEMFGFVRKEMPRIETIHELGEPVKPKPIRKK